MRLERLELRELRTPICLDESIVDLASATHALEIGFPVRLHAAWRYFRIETLLDRRHH